MRTVKKIVTGNLPIGRMYLGFADSQLGILERQRELGLKGEFRTVRPYPWLVVEAYSDKFGHREIRVHVLKQYLPEEMAQQAKKEELMICPCYKHFTFGVVEAVTPKIPVLADYETQEAYENAVDTYNDWLIDGQFSFDVWLCKGESYELVEGLKSSGWERRYPGEYVIVTIGKGMDAWDDPLDCVRTCLMDLPRFDLMAVSSVHFEAAMVKWKTRWLD